MQKWERKRMKKGMANNMQHVLNTQIQFSYCVAFTLVPCKPKNIIIIIIIIIIIKTSIDFFLTLSIKPPLKSLTVGSWILQFDRGILAHANHVFRLSPRYRIPYDRNEFESRQILHNRAYTLLDTWYIKK